MDKSTTGINYFINNSFKFPIQFMDNRCPYCGEYMKVDTIPIKGKQNRVRYICNKCKMIYPLNHIKGDPDKIIPLYDDSINDFINSFGSDIRERRFKNIIK